MKKLDKNSKIRLLLWVVAIMLVVWGSFNRYFTYVGINVTINTIAVLRVVVISGYAKQLHLGQAAFMGIGAYTSAVLMTKLGWSFWLTVPVAVIFAAFMGWVLSIPTLKLKGGAYLALVTQTFGEIIYVLVLNLTPVTNGPFGITGIETPHIGPIDLSDLQLYFFFCIAVLAAVYFGLHRIINSKYGRFFVSVRESEEAAQSLGINTRKYKQIAFSIACAVGGVAGLLYGPFIGYISPGQFRWSPSLTLVSMAIVGGLYSLKGGVIGALVLTVLPELLRASDQLRYIIYGIIVILVLAFLPDGLVSLTTMKRNEVLPYFKNRFNLLFQGNLRKKKKLSSTQAVVE